MKRFALPKMVISLPLAVLAAVGLIFINETSFHQSKAAAASIQEAQLTRESVNKLLQHLLDAETGQRGYLLTGDLRYLAPYNSATGEIDQTMDGLRRMLTPYKEQLDEFVGGVGNVIAKCVDAMPTHSEFIAKHCAAQAA